MSIDVIINRLQLTGLGLLSKQVLKLPNVRQVIGIEDAAVFAPQLHVRRS